MAKPAPKDVPTPRPVDAPADVHNPYQEGARLGRQGMLAVLRAGGSILYHGRLITQEAEMPSDAELAKGNTAAVARARVSMQAQIATLEAQMRALDSGVQGAGTTTTSTPAAPSPPRPPEASKA